MLYKKTPYFSAASFSTFLQSLLSITQASTLQGYLFSLYWLDIIDIDIKNGQRQLATILAPIKDEKGVYILFKKDTLDVLYIGSAGTGSGPASVLYTTVNNGQGGSGRVEHLLKNNPSNNSSIVKYYNNIASTRKFWDDFMNEYSIVFICVRADNNSNINTALDFLTEELKKMLHPLANK